MRILPVTGMCPGGMIGLCPITKVHDGGPIGVYPVEQLPAGGVIGIVHLQDPPPPPAVGAISITGDTGSVANVSSIHFTHAADQLAGSIAVSGDGGSATVTTPVIISSVECPCDVPGGGGPIDGGGP